MNQFRRSITNIYQTFRLCGLRIGLRVTRRILLPTKKEKAFSQRIESNKAIFKDAFKDIK